MVHKCNENPEKPQMDQPEQSKPMNTVPKAEKPSTSSEDKTNQRETSEDQRIAENIKPVLLGNKFVIHVTGRTFNSHKEFMDRLKNSTPWLQEVETVDECDFILVFCPVVSRAGTDIEAAEKSLHNISATKPAVLVVLHHTSHPECVVPDSSRAAKRENMITYDCLFHEDQGLLQCKRNADVINNIKTQIKTQTKIQNSIMVSTKWLNWNNKSEQRSSTRGSSQWIFRMFDLRSFFQETTSFSYLGNCVQFVRFTFRFLLRYFFPCDCRKDKSLGKQKKMEQDLETDAYGKSLLRLVMLGRTDSGKSSARNSILGKEEKIQAAATAATSTSTQQSESTQGEVARKKVIVVETPDWFAPGLSLEKVREDVDLCVQMSFPGPHAFLLVIPVRHYTNKVHIEDELKVIIPKMEEMFGERCCRNTIILFTVTDEHQRKNTEILIQSENEEVQTLLEKCGNRFFCLNIKESGDDSQVSELFEKIAKMVKGSETFYSSDIYLKTFAYIGKIEEKISEKLKKLDAPGNRMIMRKPKNQAMEQHVKQLNENIEIGSQEVHEDVVTMEAEREEMKITLHEMWRSMLTASMKMQEDFSRQMDENKRQNEERDREFKK